MMHENRRYRITKFKDAESLAAQIKEYSWTGCTGFEIGDYLFLNDSTSDGIVEYAVVKKSSMVQFESITFGWCDYYCTLQYIEEILMGFFDGSSFGGPMPAETLRHGKTCGLCA